MAVATALRLLKIVSATKPKLAVPITSTNATSKTTGITSGSAKDRRSRKRTEFLKYFHPLRNWVSLTQKLKEALNQQTL